MCRIHLLEVNHSYQWAVVNVAGVSFASIDPQMTSYVNTMVSILFLSTGANLTVKTASLIQGNLTIKTAKKLKNAFVISMLDYCNSLLAGHVSAHSGVSI